MKLAGYAFGPITIGACTTFSSAVIIWIFWLFVRISWEFKSRYKLPILFVALFGYAIPFAVQPFLVSIIGHGFIGILVSLVPILTIIVSIPLLGILPSRVQLTGILVGIIGIAFIVKDGLDRQAHPLFLVLALSIPIYYATSNTIAHKSLRDIPPIALVAILMTLSAVFLMPLALALESITVNEHFHVALFAIISLSVLTRGLGMMLFYKLIQAKGALFAGMVTYVIPVEVLIWSWFDNEKVTWFQISAIILVLLMVWRVQSDIIKRDSARMHI